MWFMPLSQWLAYRAFVVEIDIDVSESRKSQQETSEQEAEDDSVPFGEDRLHIIRMADDHISFQSNGESEKALDPVRKPLDGQSDVLFEEVRVCCENHYITFL